MKVVFLDIDGVLNHCGSRHDGTPTPGEPLPIPIESRCVVRLNWLIAETGLAVARARVLGTEMHE